MKQYETLTVWPISCDIAIGCLAVVNDRIHSFWLDGIISGCDLENDRVLKMLRSADDENRLYLLENAFADHAVGAWDSKYKKWTYLECCKSNVEKLLAQVAQNRGVGITVSVGQKYLELTMSCTAGNRKAAVAALDEKLSRLEIFGYDNADVEALCRDMSNDMATFIEIRKLTDSGVEADQGYVKLLDFVTGIRSGRFTMVSDR